jgi:phenylpyruvate tautomerase PptA (4-oxalocrotonate tautomerase family)
MPVIQVQALPQRPEIDVTAVLRELTRAAADAMSIGVEHVWATWVTLQPGHYVVGAAAAPEQPRDSHDPIVHVIAFEGRPTDVIERTLEAVARVLCERLELAPGTVFATYTELRAGRVYTGGAVRR